MGVFEYRTSRSLNTDGVFVNTNPDSEMGGLFTRLKSLMISELHLQWDTAFLEQYIKEQMVPKGLRWDIHPQQDKPDLESWFKYFNKTGLKLLQFLVDKKKIKLSLIDTEIKELRDKLIPYRTSAEYIALSTNLKSILEKEEKDQRIKKQKSIIGISRIIPLIWFSIGRGGMRYLSLPMVNHSLWIHLFPLSTIRIESWFMNLPGLKGLKALTPKNRAPDRYFLDHQGLPLPLLLPLSSSSSFTWWWKF